MTGLAGLFEAHRPMVSGGDDGWHTMCGCGFDELGICGAEHLAAAVTAWLAERLASEEVREVTIREVNAARFTWRGGPDESYDELLADAALAAVVGALGVEGEAGLGSREGGIGHESAEWGTGGGRVHRDAERGSNANDVIRGDG